MPENPIKKEIKRHVHGYWRGYPDANVYHSTKWTVGLLQQIVDDCRAAGYDDNTYLTAQISRDPSELTAFRLSVDEHIAHEVTNR